LSGSPISEWGWPVSSELVVPVYIGLIRWTLHSPWKSIKTLILAYNKRNINQNYRPDCIVLYDIFLPPKWFSLASKRQWKTGFQLFNR
jgi:hypothetical protein